MDLLAALPLTMDVGPGRLAVVASATLGVCLASAVIGTWRHRRATAVVPVRIHVAGTRGKSTTTRMIAAGLRAGGFRTIAKVTGSVPRIVLPDGREEDWPRRGPPSIIEQVAFLRRAAAVGADAVVVECMAIRPEFVHASEAQIVRATTAVITNVRPDHAEEIGPAPDAAARALSLALPVNGFAVLAEEAAVDVVRSRAAAIGCALDVVGTAEPEDPYAANRALALRVCARHGVDPAVAGPAIDAAAPDPGGWFARDIECAGKSFRFLGAFACNDVASLAMLWGRERGTGRPVVLMNARADRPLRTRAFVAYLAERTPRPRLFMAGPPLALRMARAAGWAADDMTAVDGRNVPQTLARLAEAASPGGLVWGVGNFRGLGEGLVHALGTPDDAC